MGACSWTQGTKIGMSHQPPMTKKNADGLGIRRHEKKSSTSGNAGR